MVVTQTHFKSKSSCFIRTVKTVSLLYLCLCFWSKFYVRPALRRQYLILGRIRFQLTLRIPPCPECPRCEYLCGGGDANYEKENSLEKCIRQDNIVQIPTRGILEHVFVDEEEQGHVDLLPSQQLLFLKTETFNLGKIGRDLQ